jgi:hypothetical protein
MQKYKQPRVTYIEYLTHDNFYLNERNAELSKMCENFKKNIDYTNNFFHSIYDISGNYSPNIKIVVYDSSNDIITYICSDSSGAFSPTIELDLSLNTLQNTMRQTNEHIGNFTQQREDVSFDGEEDDLCDMSRGFPFWRPKFYPRPRPRPYPYPHPYPYPYPYPYPPYPFDPYLLRDNEESQDQPNKISDSDNRSIADQLNQSIFNENNFKNKPINISHSTSVNGIVKTTCDASRCLLDPYLCPYPHPYYNLLDNDDDYYRSILNDISFNHPIQPTPEYPVIPLPVENPIVHRSEYDETPLDLDSPSRISFENSIMNEGFPEHRIGNHPHPKPKPKPKPHPYPHPYPYPYPHPHPQPHPPPPPHPYPHPFHKYTNGM